jgi:hypothetical protein
MSVARKVADQCPGFREDVTRWADGTVPLLPGLRQRDVDWASEHLAGSQMKDIAAREALSATRVSQRIMWVIARWLHEHGLTLTYTSGCGAGCERSTVVAASRTDWPVTRTDPAALEALAADAPEEWVRIPGHNADIELRIRPDGTDPQVLWAHGSGWHPVAEPDRGWPAAYRAGLQRGKRE